MKYLPILLMLFALSCNSQSETPQATTAVEKQLHSVHGQKPSAVERYYLAHKNDSLPSKSLGTVSNGSIENATLLPFRGENYRYFDTASYLGGRAFMNNRVAATLEMSYDSLAKLNPDRNYCYMECSNQHGGKLFPHHTHQNGLSVDFMSPMISNNAACYDLDELGAGHYFIDFDDRGTYEDNPEISIDFNQIALHLLILQSAAQKNGLLIEKVIFKMELRDELYASPYGPELRKSGIYITRNLTPLINGLHDDHYHVDFRLK